MTGNFIGSWATWKTDKHRDGLYMGLLRVVTDLMVYNQSVNWQQYISNTQNWKTKLPSDQTYIVHDSWLAMSLNIDWFIWLDAFILIHSGKKKGYRFQRPRFWHIRLLLPVLGWLTSESQTVQMIKSILINYHTLVRKKKTPRLTKYFSLFPFI